jgi:S-adenosylmethionine-diacylgycerolhomoserine-N-methlytransferase
MSTPSDTPRDEANPARGATLAPAVARERRSLAGLRNDARILWRMARGAQGATHAARLESFYRPQANGYDDFRARLLHGRDELFSRIPFPPDARWADLGAGTGENAERLGDRLGSLEKAYLVDLSSSLLEVARRRARANGWENVQCVHADMTQFAPTDGPLDVVTFSYSLTMTPDWFRAVDRAYSLLRAGGVIGVVDFYVARKHPEAGRRRHGWSARHLWPLWFATDDVFLSADHLPYLQSRFETLQLDELRGKVPYLPLARAPYYVFLGKKPVE